MTTQTENQNKHWRAFKVVLSLTVITTTVCVVGCKSSSANEASLENTLPHSQNQSYTVDLDSSYDNYETMVPFTDPVTGCKYFVIRIVHGIAAIHRLNEYGAPDCPNTPKP